MSRRSIYVPDDGVPAKTTCQCPHCGMNTTVTPIAWTLDKWICRCDNSNCNKTFFAYVNYKSVMEGHVGEPSWLYFEILETVPKFVPKRHEAIPENVWDDFTEASDCYNANARKGTVVLCRRALQNACLDRGATKQDAKGNRISLRNQIKTAFPEKDYSLIRQLSEAIKFLGDYGAHPQDDGIDDVTKQDAKMILDFTGTILDIAYIQPWNIKKLLSGNSARKASKT